jgi:flavodoxin
MNLVAFFSAEGNTKKEAERLSKILNCDLFEIKPITPYTKSDLNWMNPFSRSSKEMHKKDSRPELLEKLDSIEKYDTIYIGFPIWWYTCPHIINTFIESYDLTNKKIKVFFTSGSTKEEVIVKSMNNLYPNLVTSVKRFNGISDEEIKEWIK